MLPCPFPRDLPLERHSAKLGSPVSYRTPAGRGCITTAPGSRTSSINAFRIPRTSRGLLKTPPTRAFSLGLTSRSEVFHASSRRATAKISTALTRASDLVDGPLHITPSASGGDPEITRQFRGPRARRGRTFRARGTDPAFKSGVRPSERRSVCSFLLSLSGRQRIRPRSHSKGSTVFIAVARLWEGCLDVDCFTPTPNHAQPVDYITYSLREVKYTSPTLAVHLHRQGPFLSMSLFAPPSDNHEAHHANLAFAARSASRKARGRAHCTPAGPPAWDASRPTGPSRSAPLPQRS